MIKRIIDILVSLIAIVILTPLLAPIMILLRLTGEGYVFYKQPRVGKGGKHFNLLKFATMLKDSPNLTGGDITRGNDPRVLPVGRFLRKTKINELPQLFNIFKGDISLVGPRPLTPKNFAYYNPHVQDAIKGLKPGLTGIGSIVFRDEESIIEKSGRGPVDCYREILSPYKGELEVWYSRRCNIFLDILLMGITAWVVVFPKSKILHRVFKNLPEPPDELLKCL